MRQVERRMSGPYRLREPGLAGVKRIRTRQRQLSHNEPVMQPTALVRQSTAGDQADDFLR
jgi:hypothetical protein